MKSSNLSVIKRIGRAFLYLLIPVVTFYLLEFYLHNPFKTMRVNIQLWNWLFYWLVSALIFFACRRPRLTMQIQTVLFALIGLGNFYVYRFRGNPILPWDIYAIRTAVSVSANYDYSISGKVLFVVLGFVALLVLEHFLCEKKKVEIKFPFQLVGILACVFCLWAYTKALHQDEFIRKMRFYDKLFTADTMQYKDGTLIAFLMEIRYLGVSKPAGYSMARAEELLDGYKEAETTGKKPNIIVIMNEAFSDLDMVADFTPDRDYMPFTRSLMEGAENVVSGELNVSVLGGNTANTEFEFLTGNSMAFLTEGSVAYQQYIHGRIDSIANDLKGRGYECIAMHPYKSKGWNRNEVYPNMGFDKFYSIEAYPGAREIRNYVSDQSCYDKIIETYEKKEAGKPLFVFNVTMQNHGGYVKEFDNFEPYIQVEGVDNFSTLNYLSLIRESDIAFENLINYFANQEEETIILMFGDHQPSDTVVDPLLELSGKSCVTLSKEEEYDRFKVPFVMYANYDIEEEEGIETSSNYLSGLLFEKAGLPLTDYQLFLKKQEKEFPIVTGRRVENAEGVDGNYQLWKQKMNDYAVLQYYEMFDWRKTHGK